MENIEKATKKLDSINQWISNCDTKSSFVLTFFGVVLTIIFTSNIGNDMISTFTFEKSKELNFNSIFNFFKLAITFIFLISSTITFWHIYSTLKGRINPDIYRQEGLNVNSNIFFGTITLKTFETFESQSNNEKDEEHLNDLNSQIYINSNIVSEKFKHYNKSLLWLIISFMLFLIFTILN